MEPLKAQHKWFAWTTNFYGWLSQPKFSAQTWLKARRRQHLKAPPWIKQFQNTITLNLNLTDSLLYLRVRCPTAQTMECVGVVFSFEFWCGKLREAGHLTRTHTRPTKGKATKGQKTGRNPVYCLAWPPNGQKCVILIDGSLCPQLDKLRGGFIKHIRSENQTPRCFAPFPVELWDLELWNGSREDYTTVWK